MKRPGVLIYRGNLENVHSILSLFYRKYIIFGGIISFVDKNETDFDFN